jgi:exodeoxyribonuclease V gamma subunit
MGSTLLLLLELAGTRLTATGLETLLGCRPLLERFGLELAEATRLVEALQEAGFRWGLDGQEKDPPCHSLGWTIDRLLLGLVLPADAGLAPGETAPWEAGVPLELAGRWLHLLGRLRHWLAELRRGGTVGVWAERLRRLIDDLFGDTDDDAGERPELMGAIDAWQTAAGPCDLSLEAPVAAAALRELLGAESGRFGHRSGALTISALEPMRAIPYRVIVLMGLDADLFPRPGDRPAFHLMEGQRQLGDPHPADQDRYVLMEALLSARDHLLLSWSCRDDRTGAALPPSGPVGQWLQWLAGQLDAEAMGRLLVEHAANPLDRRNFLPARGREAPSCDRRLLEAVRRLAGDRPVPPPALLAGATLGWWLRGGSGAVATVLAYGLALLADMALRAAVFVVRPAEPLVAVAAPSVSSGLPSTFGLVYGAIFGVALLAGTTAGRAAWLVRLIAAAALITGSGARVVLGGHWASQMIASVAFGLLLALLAAGATSRAARLRTV